MTIAPAEEATLANEVSRRLGEQREGEARLDEYKQILHGTQRTAWHPVRLVREALADEFGP
jgi:hypothetical protein